MKHVAMELVVVVGGAGVGALLASDLLAGVEAEDVHLQRQLGVEVLGADGALDGREGQVRPGDPL
mgnify:CR=1 FL=1